MRNNLCKYPSRRFNHIINIYRGQMRHYCYLNARADDNNNTAHHHIFISGNFLALGLTLQAYPDG